jgi:hypothetical protein
MENFSKALQILGKIDDSEAEFALDARNTKGQIPDTISRYAGK